jgi:hypothetical protein
VNWGGSELSRKALQTKTRAQIWAEYLNELNGVSQALGKEFVVWGDFVLEKEPAILPQLNKKIIIMDWNYWDTNAEKFRASLVRVQANGSRAIGAPGLISYRWGTRPGTQVLRNMDAFADAYTTPENTASLGLVLTNWVPSRYLQNSIWDGFAYGAVAFKEGSAAAQSHALRRFVERHYGAKWSDVWSEAVQLIYEAAPTAERPDPKSPLRRQLTVPYSSEEELTALIKHGSLKSDPFTRLQSLLHQLEPTITKNLPDFRAFALSVEYLDAASWRESSVLELATKKPVDSESAQALIEKIAARDRELARALENDWDSGRPADSPAKSSPLYGFQPKDQLLFQWQKATDFTKELAGRPQRFFKLLQAASNS